jgi:hypothetical protein
MIFEIAAGIVLGLFAFILIYKYWRRLLIMMVILVGVIAIGIAMAVLIANNHTAAVIWGNVTKDWSFVYVCVLLILLGYLSHRLDTAKLPRWLHRIWWGTPKPRKSVQQCVDEEVAQSREQRRLKDQK